MGTDFLILQGQKLHIEAQLGGVSVWPLFRYCLSSVVQGEKPRTSSSSYKTTIFSGCGVHPVTSLNLDHLHTQSRGD
jgi:hypothetical protein